MLEAREKKREKPESSCHERAARRNAIDSSARLAKDKGAKWKLTDMTDFMEVEQS
jgi:hypothetical protein